MTLSVDRHRTGGAWWCRVAVASVAVALAGGLPEARAQALRFSNRREVAIPDYATLRIGPFYSTAAFSQTVGYRWSRSSGTGTDYLTANRRGVIREDGSEFPMISTLTFRNYLLLTRNADVDCSVRLSYQYYPLDTQDNAFDADLAQEGVYGTLSAELLFTPVLKGTIYDNFIYRTDYVDTRGEQDLYGGSKYVYLDNTVGFNADWLLAKDKDMGLTLSREDFIPQTSDFKDQERTTYREGLVYEQWLFPLVVVGARAGYAQTDYTVRDRPDATQQDYSLFARYNVGQGGREGLRLRLTDVSTATVGIGYSVGASGERAVGQQTVNGETTGGVAEGDSNVATLTGFAELRTQLRADLWHALSYRRYLRGGFEAQFETVDLYEYRLGWDGIATRLQAFTSLSQVEPSGSVFSSYDTWTSGLNISYPVVRRIRVWVDTRYAVRRNSEVVVTQGAPLEEIYDYTTWTSAIGTSFDVTRTITFDTYALHTERYSDANDLAYKRDIVEARFHYTHQF